MINETVYSEMLILKTLNKNDSNYYNNFEYGKILFTEFDGNHSL